jgi:hypothetical protein
MDIILEQCTTAGVAWRYGARTLPKEVPRSSPRTAALFPAPYLQLSLDLLSLPGRITPDDQVPLNKKKSSDAHRLSH